MLRAYKYNKYANLQFADKLQIKSIQNRLFLEHFYYTVKNSPFYGKLYSSFGIDTNKIKTIEDLSKLPFTQKKDLDKDLICVDQTQIVDVCLTSGTSGTPTIVPLTKMDLQRLAFNEEIAFKTAGVTSKDTMLICAAIDKCFMAGIAYFLGGVNLNARMVRAGSNNSAQTWEIINLTGATVIVGVPSLIYRIGEYALKNNQNPKKSSVRKLIAIGESIRDAKLNLIPVAAELEKMWGARIYSTYASTEMATTFCECEKQQGGHLRPELNIVEIVDDKGHQVDIGETGEVVTTPLGITGMPLIRFKTGDVSFIIHEKCECGRTTNRLGPIIGRKNQMLKYKGTVLFPASILSIIEGDSRVHGGYIEVYKNPDGTDRILLCAALSEPCDSLNLEKIDWIKEKIRARVRVTPEIKLISKEKCDNKIYQLDKKRKRETFFDKR